jgi:hypothetical protein
MTNKIIYPKEIEYLKPVTLNNNGKTIGFIVKYNHRYFYLSRRANTDIQEHVFRMFEGGFGLDKALFKEIIQGKNELLGKIDGIIIFYDGKKEKRYFYASIDTWFENSENYSIAKEKDNSFESYGDQKILRGSFFSLLGLHPDDYKVREMYAK